MEGLANQVSALNTNDSLKEVSASKNNPPIQSVLDALPATANASAFGASLQKRFIQVEGSGVSLESLRVDPVGDQLGESLGIGDMNTGTINFSFKVSASTQGQSIEFAYTALKNLLDKMEKSIRPIDIISVKIEVQNNSVDLSAEGRTFFEPKQTVELRDKVVRP